jgi:hypothetical protein
MAEYLLSDLVRPADPEILTSSRNATFFPDLVVQLDDIKTPTSFPEEKGKVRVIVTNHGDKRVRGPLGINLYASPDSVLDLPLNEGNLAGTDELLGTLNRCVNLAPGQSRSFTLNFAGPEFRTASVVTPGSYYLLAGVDPGNRIAESNEENNLASTHISADGSDVVIDWNATLLNAIQAEGTFAPQAARNQAIVHTAIYDAVNAIDRSHSAYFVNVDPSEAAGASPEAAAAAAAYRALVNLYPEQAATFDLQLSRSLAEIPDGPSESKGIALGEYVADQILALRSTDGAAEAQGHYTPGTEPGDWRPTPPNFDPATLPQWGQVTPFAIPLVSSFRPPGPPELNTDQYAADLNEVKALGSANSSIRSSDQTEIAKFWSFDHPNNIGVTGLWNKIAEEVALQQGNTLEENARLFALLNIAQADGGIVTLDAKYTYNQWRPITAIREADTDGRADTVTDPDWTPLLPTPSAPDYISGHAVQGGASAVILTSFFGDNFSFTTTSSELPGVSRSYDSFFEAADENALSRLYGGVHFRSSDDQGLATGLEIGNYVAQNILVPTNAQGVATGLELATT